MVTCIRITGTEGELFVRNAGQGAPLLVPAALGAALAPVASLYLRLLSLQHAAGGGPCSLSSSVTEFKSHGESVPGLLRSLGVETQPIFS